MQVDPDRHTSGEEGDGTDSDDDYVSLWLTGAASPTTKRPRRSSDSNNSMINHGSDNDESEPIGPRHSSSNNKSTKRIFVVIPGDSDNEDDNSEALIGRRNARIELVLRRSHSRARSQNSASKEDISPVEEAESKEGDGDGDYESMQTLTNARLLPAVRRINKLVVGPPLSPSPPPSRSPNVIRDHLIAYNRQIWGSKIHRLRTTTNSEPEWRIQLACRNPCCPALRVIEREKKGERMWRLTQSVDHDSTSSSKNGSEELGKMNEHRKGESKQSTVAPKRGSGQSHRGIEEWTPATAVAVIQEIEKLSAGPPLSPLPTPLPNSINQIRNHIYAYSRQVFSHRAHCRHHNSSLEIFCSEPRCPHVVKIVKVQGGWSIARHVAHRNVENLEQEGGAMKREISVELDEEERKPKLARIPTSPPEPSTSARLSTPAPLVPTMSATYKIPARPKHPRSPHRFATSFETPPQTPSTSSTHHQSLLFDDGDFEPILVDLLASLHPTLTPLAPNLIRLPPFGITSFQRLCNLIGLPREELKDVLKDLAGFNLLQASLFCNKLEKLGLRGEDLGSGAGKLAGLDVKQEVQI